MNNYPSNNFSTVFFLVVLFIGMGVLSYHAYEITVENGQLNEAVKILQTDVASLNTENAALKTENTTLKTENAAITNENSQLKTTLEKEIAENISLKASDAEKLAELEKLRREYSELKTENLQLKTIVGSDGGSSQEDIEVIQSTLLPTDLESWLKIVAVVIIAAILAISFTTYVLAKDIRRKKAASLLGVGKSRTPHIIESRFVNR